MLDEHRRECDAILALPPAGTPTRPAIFEPERPGNAWDLELEALSARHPEDDVRFAFRSLAATIVEADEEDPPKAEKKQALKELLTEYREAFRCRESIPPHRPGGMTISDNLSADFLRWASAEISEGRHAAALEALVIALALAQDVARFGDYVHRGNLLDLERRGTKIAQTLMKGYALTREEIKTAEGWLDRLARARPTLHSILVSESALTRKDVLDGYSGVFLSTSGINPAIEPTWRDLWSDTLCKARRLGALRRIYRAVEGVERLPTWEQEREAERRLSHFDLREFEPGEAPEPLMYRAEASNLLRLALFRIAVAIACFESEKGSFPEKLEDLVPAYLASIPACPYTGEVLRYEKGRLWAEAAILREQGRGDEALFKGEEADWTVRRR